MRFVYALFLLLMTISESTFICPVANVLGDGLKLTDQWYQSTLDNLGTMLEKRNKNM